MKAKSNEKQLPHPVCFKEVRIGPERKFIRKACHYNQFYKDTRFAPIRFYKQIVKL